MGVVKHGGGEGNEIAKYSLGRVMSSEAGKGAPRWFKKTSPVAL